MADYTYQPTNWVVGKPISQELMNNIENGIVEAFQALNLRYTKAEVESKITIINNAIAGVRDTADNALSIANTASSDTKAGKDAWAQILPLIQLDDGTGDIIKSLATRITEDETAIGANTGEITQVKRWVTDATKVGTVRKAVEGGGYYYDRADALSEKIADMDRHIDDAEQDIGNIVQTISPNNGRSFADRLYALDANTVPEMNVPAIISEIKAARGTNAQNGANTNLSQRFTQDEARLTAIDGNTTPTRTLPSVITEIANAHRTNDDTLDGRFDSIDGGSAPIRTLPSIITEVNNAHRSTVQGDTLNQRFNGIDTQITTLENNMGSGFDSTNTVAAKIAAAEAAAKGYTDTKNTEYHVSEINNAHRSGVNNDTLDNRFDDVEDRTTVLETKVTNIANELSMTNIADQVVDTTSRIDTLESNVVEMANEIGMLQNGAEVQSMATAIDGTNTRIDRVQTEVENARGQTAQTLGARLDGIDTTVSGIGQQVSAHETDLNNVTTGLKVRVSTIESDLNTANTGLKAKVASLEQAMTSVPSTSEIQEIQQTVEGHTTTIGQHTTTLSQHTTAIQNNANAIAANSTTIILAKTEVTFDNHNVPTGLVSGTVTEKDDYLIQSPADNKYYYWKYINNTWTLISGDSASNGGGTGNNNAVIYESEEAFNTATATDKDANTDYYVLEDDVGYHHYRFIYDETEETWNKIEIGAATNIDKNNIKKYNIIKRAGTKKDENDQDVSVNYLDLYEYDYGVINEDNFNPLEEGVTLLTSVELPAGGGGGSDEGGLDVRRITPYSVTAVQKTTDVVPLQFFFTTGSVSGSGFYTLTMTHDGRTTTLIEREELLSGDPANASYTWPTKEVEIDGATQTVPMEPNDPNLPVGFYQIDIAPYCTETGVDFIYNLTIVNAENATQHKTPAWSVRVINLSVSSLYSDNTILNLGTGTTFTYIPVGNIEKTAHIKIDGVEVATRDLARTDQNKEFTYDIAAKNVAGVHSVEMYLSARVSGKDIYSNHIFKDIIWRDPAADTIFISSPYRDRPERIALQQYKTITIPYTLAGNINNNYTVQYYVDSFENLINEETFINNNIGSWTYRVTEAGNHDLIIKCGETYITIEVAVESLDIDISPVISNLAIDFNPIGMNNNSTNREWSNSNYHLTVSNNFDWYNGGYGSDATGSYFLVKAGTRAYFDYKMFKSYQHAVGENTYETRSTVFRDGAEMKIIFKTAAVRDASATWFTNMGKTSESDAAKEVGIQLNVHEGWLKTDSASNKEINGVAATNTYLYFPYSEEDKIELDISINKQADAATKGLFLMSYEDGCPSKAYPYSITEALYHTTNDESIITIGSDDCDVYIYRFKIYTAALDTEDVLRNFIADGKDVEESISRYERNSIYWDTQNASYTPYEGEDTVLDPERLAVKMPDVKILMLDTPRFTTSKKDFVANSSLRCIHAPGGKVYPSRGKEDNWLFYNGYHAGQGTTSDKYGNAGRNVDFLFECDGVHNPSDKVKDEKFIPNYQSALIRGYGTDEAEDPTYCLDWKDQDTWQPNTAYTLLYTMSDDSTHPMLVRYNGKVYKCLEAHTSGETFDATKWEEQEDYSSKVSLTSTSIPNNFFNLKVNIASSENVNNALLQKRYNDYLTYLSPAYMRDHRIKNDMEFVPALLFVRENDEEHTTETIEGNEVINYTNHKEFNDTNWHFYALGNIGDSKKTDYTRAYDPTDINEFTLEISDNNTNNSQFQSGVYYSTIYYDSVASPVVADIGKYYEADGEVTLVEGESNRYTGTFILTTDTEINNGKTYYVQARMIEAYHAEQDKDDDGTLLDTFTAKSDAGESVQTMAYAFPITMEEWTGLDENEEPRNMRYWSLYNEELDGDHSFEMRYAYYGNYRDGKLVNGNKTESKAVLKRNSDVWRAFYTWLITATDEEFVEQLDEWVVRRSVAFFYAFTHYYTMMDNRAKNTFWHFAKTGKHRKVLHPMKEMIHTYDENPSGDAVADVQDADIWNGTFVRTSDTDLDANKQYYTEYAFDMWVYDCDTAIGIDNNGELVFPYGKEDTDYRIDGDASSSYVFNGAGSIFWRRLSKSFNSDIVSAFTGADERCFNAEHLIQEFDKVQGCYPEAIWRLDVERKYIRSFTGDYGYTRANPYQKVFLTRQETRFLRDMMQGRKKYQRRQWCKDQDVYFGSKYLLPNVFSDLFEFSCYNPGGMAVTPNWDLTITPYQDMYINISYAETFARPFRAKAGETYEFKSILNDMNDSRIRIYGANHIQALAGKAKREDPNDPDKITGAEGLASFYMKANNFQHTHKLRKLIIGTPNTAYENGNFTTLNITDDNPILEVLDIQNCNNLGGQLNLSNSTSIQRIEAQGTQITSVNLPPNTGIQVLHLPETINNITLYSAKSLTEITLKERDGTVNTSNLATLLVSDSDYSAVNDELPTVNWMGLAASALSHLSSLQLIGLRSAYIGNISDLEPFALRKDQLGTTTNEAGDEIYRVWLTGYINVNGGWSDIEKEYYGEPDGIWPNLILNTIEAQKETKWKVTYKYPAGVHNGDEYYSMYVNDQSDIVDICYGNNAIKPFPTRPDTAQYTFLFGSYNQADQYIAWSGWKRQGASVTIAAERSANNGITPRVTTNLTLEMVFTPVDREYEVRWYMRKLDNGNPNLNTLVYSSDPVPYGGGENLAIPTVADIHAAHLDTAVVTSINRDANPVTCSYEIFDGWDKLPVNINPTASDQSFNIFAKWIKGTNVPLTTIFNDVTLSPVQLLILSKLESNERANYLHVNDRITLEMGQDSNEPGTLLIGPGSEYTMTDGEIHTVARFDAAIETLPFASSIQPLASGHDAFTIAIDYRFDMDAVYADGTKEAVLAACYATESGTVRGFKLFCDCAKITKDGAQVTAPIRPRIGFGETTATNSLETYSVRLGSTDSAYKRNMVVLRHPAGSSTLYVYSGVYSPEDDMDNLSTFVTSLDSEEFVQTLEWNNVSTNAPLTFGRLNPSLNLSEIVAGKGTIYWAKYWDKDLGVGECKRLAAWSHETMTFALEEFDGMDTDRIAFNTTETKPPIVFTALTSSQYSRFLYKAPRVANEKLGWEMSDLREIANERIFFGLPIHMQAIIAQSPIASKYATYTKAANGFSWQYIVGGVADATYDYIFLPSMIELGGNNDTYSAEATGKFKWLNSTYVNVKSFVSSNNSWSTVTDSSNANYLNLRFPLLALKTTGNNIYINYTGSDPVYNKIGASNIQRGDIFIRTLPNDAKEAYIYVSAADVVAGAPIVIADSGLFSCARGGWMKAENWWSRSVFDMNSTYGTFMFTNEIGKLVDTGVADATNSGYNFSYSFAI